jgi:Predicted nucleotide-binding protein containing TIR-like domain
VISDAYQKLLELSEARNENVRITTLKVEHDDATWQYDTLEEFRPDYRKYRGYAEVDIFGQSLRLFIYVQPSYTGVTVMALTRPEIETIYAVFERHLEASRLPEPIVQSTPVIFIGHGRSAQWRDLKDHLQDKHGFKVEAYETGARAGHTIRDILEEMVLKSSFALLVLTAEDEQADGSYHARQNVIHETGLFQGRLGFSRAIVLMEQDVQEFSNIQGIQQIRYSKGNIKETFGEVLATLKREFSI